MKKYAENMQNTSWGGVGENKDMKHVKSTERTSHQNKKKDHGITQN